MAVESVAVTVSETEAAKKFPAADANGACAKAAAPKIIFTQPVPGVVLVPWLLSG